MHVHVLHLVPFVFCRNMVVEMFFHAFDSYMVWDFSRIISHLSSSLPLSPSLLSSLSLTHSFSLFHSLVSYCVYQYYYLPLFPSVLILTIELCVSSR